MYQLSSVNLARSSSSSTPLYAITSYITPGALNGSESQSSSIVPTTVVLNFNQTSQVSSKSQPSFTSPSFVKTSNSASNSVIQVSGYSITIRSSPTQANSSSTLFHNNMYNSSTIQSNSTTRIPPAAVYNALLRTGMSQSRYTSSNNSISTQLSSVMSTSNRDNPTSSTQSVVYSVSTSSVDTPTTYESPEMTSSSSSEVMLSTHSRSLTSVTSSLQLSSSLSYVSARVPVSSSTNLLGDILIAPLDFIATKSSSTSVSQGLTTSLSDVSSSALNGATSLSAASNSVSSSIDSASNSVGLAIPTSAVNSLLNLGSSAPSTTIIPSITVSDSSGSLTSSSTSSSTYDIENIVPLFTTPLQSSSSETMGHESSTLSPNVVSTSSMSDAEQSSTSSLSSNTATKFTDIPSSSETISTGIPYSSSRISTDVPSSSTGTLTGTSSNTETTWMSMSSSSLSTMSDISSSSTTTFTFIPSPSEPSSSVLETSTVTGSFASTTEGSLRSSEIISSVVSFSRTRTHFPGDNDLITSIKSDLSKLSSTQEPSVSHVSTVTISRTDENSYTTSTTISTLIQQTSWLPKNLLTDSSTSQNIATSATKSDTSEGSTATTSLKLASTVPVIILPPDATATADPDINSVSLVQIGFKSALNYPFVVSHSLAAAQIFSFLPTGIATGIGATLASITVRALLPYIQEGQDYITTVAHLDIPTENVVALAMSLTNSSSKLYTGQSFESVTDLMALINPYIPLLISSANSQSTTFESSYYLENQMSNTVATSNGDKISISQLEKELSSTAGSLDTETIETSPNAATIAILFGVTAGALIFLGLIYMSRMRKSKHLKHQRSNSLMAESDISSSVPRSQISAPLTSQNSLGWNTLI